MTRTVTIFPQVPGQGSGNEPPVFLPEEVVAGRFRIVRSLGAGGMGQVFEVEDLELGGSIALKVIRPRATLEGDVEALFRREVQMARRVTHPNVCRVFDLVLHHPGIEDSGWGQVRRPILALTMELLEGETLAARIARQGALPWSEALDLLRELAAALDAAHEVGVCHCDFKSSNVILTPSRGVVTDFGLARSVWTEEEGLDSSLRGTPAFLAPEVLKGGPPTAASDLYALGMVAYQVLGGSLPGRGEAGRALSRRPKVPAAVVAVLERATHRIPEERFPDGASLVSALEDLSPPLRAARRWPFAFAIFLAFLAVVAYRSTWGWSFSEEEISAEVHLESARKALRGAEYSVGRGAAARAARTAHLMGQPDLEAEAHLLVASALEAMGEPARADAAMTDARRILEAAGDRCGLARASLILRDTVDAERSPLPMEELPEIFAECEDPARQAIALAHRASARVGVASVEGDRLIRKARELAQESGDARSLAQVWNTTGGMNYGKEDLRASEAAFARAIEEARRAEDPYLLAGILCNRSWILGWLGQYEEEEAVLQEAGLLARRIGNRYLLARILATEAKHHERRGDLEGAAEKLREAYQLSLALGDSGVLNVVLAGQATLHERQEQWDQALVVRQSRAKLWEELGSSLDLDRERLALARLLLKLGRIQDAQHLVDELQARFPLAEDGDSTAIYSRFQQAQIYFHEGRFEEAARVFQQTLPQLVTKEEVGLRRDAARLAVELDQRLGEPHLESLWRRLAAAPLHSTASPEAVDRALQLRADLGRILWFQGKKSDAHLHFRAVVGQAQKVGRTALVPQISAESEALRRWQDYWQW